MANANTRIRLPHVLAEFGGSTVRIRRKGTGVMSSHSPEIADVLEWLQRPQVPGFYCIDKLNRLEDGWWEYCIAISDPNSAFEFKIRFA